MIIIKLYVEEFSSSHINLKYSRETRNGDDGCASSFSFCFFTTDVPSRNCKYRMMIKILLLNVNLLFNIYLSCHFILFNSNISCFEYLLAKVVQVKLFVYYNNNVKRIKSWNPLMRFSFGVWETFCVGKDEQNALFAWKYNKKIEVKRKSVFIIHCMMFKTHIFWRKIWKCFACKCLILGKKLNFWLRRTPSLNWFLHYHISFYLVYLYMHLASPCNETEDSYLLRFP